MKTLEEEDLIFNVSLAIRSEKFDDNSIHGTKSTMKRVDFIIEENERVIFIEGGMCSFVFNPQIGRVQESLWR